MIKELAPVGLLERGTIRRDDVRGIVVRKTLRSMFTWHRARARFRAAYKLNRALQADAGLAPLIVPAHRCVRANGTLYAISFELPGQPLNTLQNLSPEDILRLGIVVADMTARMHRLGWLVVDIKPSNYILSQQGSGAAVRLTDFDSAVPMGRVKRVRKFMCSNETAAPEMLKGEGKTVGTHSDVYSIAAMSLMALARQPLIRPAEIQFDDWVRPLLRQWRIPSVEALRGILLASLQADPSKRVQTCEALADGMREVCEMEGFNHEDLFSQR